MSSLQTRPPGLFVVHHPTNELVGAFVPAPKDKVVVLGKAESTAVPALFKGTSAGRQQCQLEWKNTGPTITALRSRTPTLVNAKPITDYALQPGDVVGCGDVLFVYQDRTESGGAHAIIPGVSHAAFTMRHRIDALGQSQEHFIVHGPTGTEKLRAARGIHAASQATGSFIGIDCGQTSTEQLQTRLFTNASTPVQASPPLIESAQSGLLFLDNADQIDDQLFDDLIERAVSTRLVFGVAELNERWDPFDALFVPPLRTRREDIPHWILAFAREFKCHNARWDTELAWRWLGYSWPGNTDELHRIVARLCQDSGDSQIWRLQQHLAHRLSPIFIDDETSTVVDGLTPDQLLNHLRAHGGKIHRAATDLGLHPNELIAQLTAWNLDPASFR